MDAALISNWLSREGGDVLRWWLLVTLAGAAAWPLLFRLLGGLPDRGYTLARAAGVMLTGFLFWFLGSLGLLRNSPAGMVVAWLLVLVMGLAAFLRWRERPALRPWLREHWPLILVTEVLFLGLFFGWAIIRAANPEMASTEKPMEIMFVNSIRASATFPPHDAWMSGYAISYYYFGYVLIAMLADLSGVSSSIAFNTTIALIFALTGIGVFGLVYNMVRAGSRRAVRSSRAAALGAGVLGLVFLILMGNLGTALIEFPYRGYTPGLVNAQYFDFWDVEGRDGTTTVTLENGTTASVPVDSNNNGVPDWKDDPLPLDKWSFTYGVGWRYSRIVHDRDLSGTPHPIQPITEFPNFSFALADLHPHVLGLPFAVLAIGLALNLVLAGRSLARWEYPFYAVWVGGMIFMNSWDAIYIPLLIGAEALRRVLRNGRGVLHWEDLRALVRFAVAISGLAVIAYLPWIVSFTSQASGVLPNVIYPTPWQQYVLQFGAFLVILSVYLLVEMRRAGWRFYWQAGLMALVSVAGVLIVAVVFLAVAAWNNASLRGAIYSAVPTGSNLSDLLPDVLARRGIGLPTELLLLGFIFLVVGRLFARPALLRVTPDADANVTLSADDTDEAAYRPVRSISYSPATGFALLLIGAGAVLTLAPDFVYLHDNFGVRINTVFKLYYQGWIMFSVAAAFAVWSVLAGGAVTLETPETAEVPVKKSKSVPVAPRQGAWVWTGRGAFALVVIVLVGAGLLYPLTAVRGRALVDTGRLTTADRIAACERGEAWAVSPDGSCPQQNPLTLNGVPTMISADEYAAVQCLAGIADVTQAVLAEAPGGAYEPQNSRFSGLTGIPTLVGWQNHERQWRGDTYPAVTDARIENGQRRDRVSDVQELYTTQDWARAWQVIDRYGIDYIVVGASERSMIMQMAGNDSSRLSDYQNGLDKFAQVLTPVCQFGSTAVYRVAPE